MARRSLRPSLNQIRGWVRQGRTDAWIAHQLEATVQQIQAFKREHDLVAGEDGEAELPAGADFGDEIDLRAEDDALIAAELEAAQARALEEETKAAAEAEAAAAAEAAAPPARRRTRRSPRAKRKGVVTLEGTFDHGEEGYGLWLDPEIEDSAIYAEHWAGHRPVEVTVEEDRIVIRRAGEDDEDEDDE